MGVHCETTATGVLLDHIGVPLSEPMLFGLGQGLGFIYWDTKNTPFLGGRSKPFALTRNLADRLGLTLRVEETTSARKAWRTVADVVDTGRPVGLQLDSYHLEYFTSKVHFGGHFVALRGYDDQVAHLVDTDQQGGEVTTSLTSLALARAERGPMTAHNRSYTLTGTAAVTRDTVLGAIRATAQEFLHPPIANLGHRGIRKAAATMPKWEERGVDLKLVATLMERGGTGGALFRNLYRDFLAECGIEAGYDEIAPLWTEAAELVSRGSLAEAGRILLELADREHAAMTKLIALS